MHASIGKQRNHSPLPMGSRGFSHPQEIWAPSCTMVTWKEKYHHYKYPSPILSSERGADMMSYGLWAILWVTWHQPSWLCPLPAPCAAPAPHWWSEEQKRPWISVLTRTNENISVLLTLFPAQIQNTALCWLHWRKNSIPSKASTKEFPFVWINWVFSVSSFWWFSHVLVTFIIS